MAWGDLDKSGVMGELCRIARHLESGIHNGPDRLPTDNQNDSGALPETAKSGLCRYFETEGVQAEGVSRRFADQTERPREMIIQRKLPLPQYFLDANRVNAKGKLPAMNQLEKWHADGVISLMFPEPAQNEAEASGNARRTRKAREYWASVTGITTDEEGECLRKIERIIFGDEPLSPQDKNDVLNVFTARKYFAILVTADRKLLAAATRLRSEFRGIVDVMTDESAVERVRIRICERDKMARTNATLEGCRLPDWVGKD